MTTHRYFAASDATYEAMRAAVDLAWGYPTPHTLTCVPPAVEQWHYVAGMDNISAEYRGICSEWPPSVSPRVGWYYVLSDPLPVGAPSELLAGHAIRWDGQSWIDCGPYKVVIALTLEWLSWQPVPSMIGGAIGLGLAYLLTEVLSIAFAAPLEITGAYVFLAIFVSSAVGVISGWYPASKAASLDPVEALRAD